MIITIVSEIKTVILVDDSSSVSPAVQIIRRLYLTRLPRIDEWIALG